MSGKFMKVKRFAIPTLTLVIIASQLMGCAAANQSELLEMINQGDQIEIEVAVPINEEQGTEESITWEELASLTTNDTLRSEWDDILGIINTETGKNGVLYVDVTGVNNNNNTLQMALHNRAFVKLMEDEDSLLELAEASMSQYADLDAEEEMKAYYMGINGYFNLLPDATPNYCNADSTLTRLEFMSMVTRAETPVQELEADTAFATAGTGGFGIRNNSLASFSAIQQIIVTVGMLMFSINFNSYYLILRLKFRDAFNTEVRTFLIIVAAVIGIITLDIYESYGSVTEALRHAAFTVASLISTTGFGTENFDLWPSLSKTLLIMIMFVGGCAGSTAGGMKVSRWLISIKGFIREMFTLIHPRQVKKVTLDGRPVDKEVVRSVSSYIVCFVLIFITSLLVISLDGRDLVTTFTAVAATINNVGPGLGEVGPTSNFADFSNLSKLMLTFNMIAGRLELFPMLILLSPSTWRKNS